MTIHPHKPVAITQSPKRRRSDLVGPVALLAVAVMLGVAIFDGRRLPVKGLPFSPEGSPLVLAGTKCSEG